MNKIITTLIAVIATIFLSYGQNEEVITKSGKKVILNSNGTWKYAVEQTPAAGANPVIHFEIGCKDLAKTTAFYTSVFNWTSVTEGLSSNLNTNSPDGIQGHITALGHEPFNYVAVYVQVDDITEQLKKIQTAGGQKIVGPFKLPTGQQFAWFKDPEGNVLGLLTKK